jgi:hypothetical protein
MQAIGARCNISRQPEGAIVLSLLVHKIGGSVWNVEDSVSLAVRTRMILSRNATNGETYERSERETSVDGRCPIHELNIRKMTVGLV